MIKIIRIKQGNIDEFLNKSFEDQLVSYFHTKDCMDDVFVQWDETEKNVVLTKFTKSVVYSGDHFFLKRTEESKFIYNKIEKKVKCNTFSKHDILYYLIEFPQFDWLNDAVEQDTVSYVLFCNSIVRDILLGKLTNAESIVKKYLALNKIKGVNWRIFVMYLKWYSFPISWLRNHTTNTNEAMELLTVRYLYYRSGKDVPTELKEQYEKSIIFRDMINDTIALNTKVNPRWSLKRMKEEHIRMIRELRKFDLEHKEQVDIYIGCPDFNYPCKLLSTEKEVFVEGLEMNHCIYSCYWSKIKDYRYLAFSFTAPERFTLGLKLTDAGWKYDQAYLKYDEPISQDSKDMIDKFLTDPDVINILKDLSQRNVPTNIEEDKETEDDGYVY